jgi:asparagine N-glycosylation enzyme membrane subunit Stt3
VLATLAVAGVSGVLWLGERWAPGGGMRRRAVLAGGAVVAILAGAALSAEIREALGTALGFLAQADRVGAVTGEQNPLFGAWDRMPAARPTYAWGWFVYAIPFAPAAAAWLGLSPRARPGTVASALLLAGWVFFFGVLALDQRRYGNDFAPAFALLFGVVAVRVMARLTSRLPASRLRAAARAIGVIVLGLALLWPAIHVVYGPRARASLNALQASGKPRPDVMRSVAYTLTRFMAEVRRVTPETSGYMSPGPPPAYGVIAHPNLGHALQYGARRAASTDPFWWYIGPENWETSFAFLEARTEADALRWARALKGRYVLTSADEDPRTVAGQLYAHDGRATARRPALVHFRLISESPPGGKAMSEIFRPRAGNRIAYKLFEIVPGARLIVEAAPGEEVEVSLELRSSQGRAFSYRAVARAGANGEASLRVPYATEPSRLPKAGPRTRALGLYQVEVAGSVEAASVSEEAVVVGARVHARGRRSGSRPPASGL